VSCHGIVPIVDAVVPHPQSAAGMVGLSYSHKIWAK
jgi:hypothetical protein